MTALGPQKQPETAVFFCPTLKKSLSSMSRYHVITVGIDDGQPNLLPA
jgi:hypothetical protein